MISGLIIDIVLLLLVIITIEIGYRWLTESVPIKPKEMKTSHWAARISGALAFVWWVLYDLNIGLTLGITEILFNISISVMLMSGICIIFLVAIAKNQKAAAEPDSAPEMK